MRSVVIGAGEVGHHIAGLLRKGGHSVTLIDSDAAAAGRVDAEIDAKVITGNGTSARLLLSAGIREADNLLALTSDDRTNLVTCAVSKDLNPNLFSVVRIHDQTYLESELVNHQRVFKADFLVNPERLTAIELAKKIRNPGRVAVENFARGQVDVQQVELSARSRHAGRTLRQIRLQSKIGLVIRNGVARVPAADLELAAGDILTLYGTPEDLAEERQALDPQSRVQLVRVVLFGASEVAINLLQRLNNPRFRVRIIEPSGTVCREVAERFPQVTVVHGDATSRRLLEEEQVGSADHFVACTRDDEENIMTCLQAVRLGTRRVHLVINKSDYESLLHELRDTLGVEHIVSPRTATAGEIVKYLTRQPVIHLGSLTQDEKGPRLLEILVRKGSRVDGKTLLAIQPYRPAGVVFVALLRDFRAWVPGADDPIRAGDRVVAIVDEAGSDDLIALLT